VTAPDNQQERLDDYLAGYVDGEGSFHVAIQRNPSTRFGWQLVPEFHVSQNPERASILELLRARLGCGRIRPNARAGGRDRSLVYVVRNRDDLLTKVIPFFSSPPHPQREAPRVRDLRRHRHGDGEPGASGSGRVPSAPRPRRQHERWRQVPKARLVIQNPQRPYAEHGHQPVKRWSDPHGDMGSQAEQKRPGRRVATSATRR
jgi:hypothetical protein